MDESLEVSGDMSGWIFFWIFKYALFISSFVNFFFSSKFKILHDSEKDRFEILLLWLLLNENLPLLLKVWISLKRDINWKSDKPFNFNNAKLASVRGKVNKNLPPMANKIAKISNPTIINYLRLFDIFFDEILLKNLSSK